jgi:hypothetical protein
MSIAELLSGHRLVEVDLIRDPLNSPLRYVL